MTNAVEPVAMLTAASSYAARGYSVFPCVMGDKQPATKNGLKDATRDIEQIKRWWKAMPYANVAIATTGLLVVDFDTIDGKANQWLQDQPERLADLEAAPVSLTPRGGRHYVFKQGDGQSYGNTAGKVAGHVDTRGTGGYIVAAPSMVNGRVYRWASDELPSIDELPKLPAWLCGMLDSSSRAGQDVTGVAELLKDSADIPDGIRDISLFRMARIP